MTDYRGVDRVVLGHDDGPIFMRLQFRIVTSEAPGFWGNGSLWNDLLDTIDELVAVYGLFDDSDISFLYSIASNQRNEEDEGRLMNLVNRVESLRSKLPLAYTPFTADEIREQYDRTR